MIIQGGINSITVSKDIYSLDLENNIWKKLQPNRPLPRKYSHQMKIENEILTISGGFPINSDNNFLYILNLNSMEISYKELIGNLPSKYQPPIKFKNHLFCFPSLASKSKDFMKVCYSIKNIDQKQEEEEEEEILFKEIEITNESSFPLGRRFRYFCKIFFIISLFL